MKIIVTFTFLDWLYIMKSLKYKEVNMKKILFFLSLISVMLVTLFTSCGSGSSVYSESWFTKKGYITYTKDPFDGYIIKNFYAEGAEIPVEEAPVFPAKRYSHRYEKTPSCRFIVKQWMNDPANEILGYETIATYRFTITEDPEEYVDGFWFWCDKEYVYVVNTLYNDDFKDKKSSKPSSSANDYKFIIDINGICDYEFEMTEEKKQARWYN